jgi:ribosome maturation factor RimP
LNRSLPKIFPNAIAGFAIETDLQPIWAGLLLESIGTILKIAEYTGGRKPTFLLAGRVGGLLVSDQSSSRTWMVDLEKIRTIAERVVTSEALELVDVELKGGRSNQLLRIYIDKPQGITHADCQLVSEQLSAILDVEDPFPGSYVLEVSSPGLDRKLVKPSDYTHFVGRRARLVLREPVENEKVFEGRLAGLEAGRVRLEVDNGALKELELANISKARLVVEL